MLFDKLFKKKTEPQISVNIKVNTSKKEQMPKSITPKLEYKVLVLYWISKKKKGYDITSKKYPKWFLNDYGLDFDAITQEYLVSNDLEMIDNSVLVTDKGKETLKENSHILYIFDHPGYELKIKDFTSNKNFGKVKNEDIAWGIFNKRVLTYTNKKMWDCLNRNYVNMADLLISEEKYRDALDYVFASAFIETSGMEDDNKLKAIRSEHWTKQNKIQVFPNGNPDIFMLELGYYSVKKPFEVIQNKLCLDWDELKTIYYNSPLRESMETVLPFWYYNKEEAFEYFKDYMQNDNGLKIYATSHLRKTLKYNKPNENSTSYFYNSIPNQLKKEFGK